MLRSILLVEAKAVMIIPTSIMALTITKIQSVGFRSERIERGFLHMNFLRALAAIRRSLNIGKNWKQRTNKPA